MPIRDTMKDDQENIWPLRIGAVAKVKGSFRSDGMAMVELCTKYRDDAFFIEWLRAMPFREINLIFRYGTVSSEPEVGKVRKGKLGLETAIEIPMERLREVGEKNFPILFEKMVLQVLIAVSERYKVDGSEWQRRLDDLT